MPNNFKSVVGWDDNLSNHQQNYSHTAYAVSKMRAGRVPLDDQKNIVTDLNKIFRPGLYYLEAGATHADNAANSVSSASIYVYHLVQDPDETPNGGHIIENRKNLAMCVRQIQYSNSSLSGLVTTRIGQIDPEVQTYPSPHTVSTVERIQETCRDDAVGTTHYAFVIDIAQWIRYTVEVGIGENHVNWEPAIIWGSWKSIAGDSTIINLNSSRLAELNTHYVSFGPYWLELPVADTCPLGSKVILDQWENTGRVYTRSAGGDILYDMLTNPTIKTVGLSDMKFHDDTGLLPEGSLFVKNFDRSWSHAHNGITYLVKQVRLKSGEYRYAIINAANDVIFRVCYNDLAYPHDAASTFILTTDSVFVAGKTYYVKETSEMLEHYVVATDIEIGASIPANTYYEAFTPVLWYDVNYDGTSYTAADITLSDILGSVRKYTKFTTNDIADNISGCTTYIFEVTFDPESLSARRWSMIRATDFDAYLNTINDTMGRKITELETRLDIMGPEVQQIRDGIEVIRYADKGEVKHVSTNPSGYIVIYGNRDVGSSETIEYDPAIYYNPGSLHITDAIVKFFMARVTPVYCVSRVANADPVTLYLPGTSEALLGKKIKIRLDPGTVVNVYDDNITTKHTYTFSGAEIIPASNTSIAEIEFEMIKFYDRNEGIKYAWMYTGKQYTCYLTY